MSALDAAGMEQVTELLVGLDEITRRRVMELLPPILSMVAREGHAGRLALAAAGVLLLPRKQS